MKCDELKAYKGDVTIPVYGTIADAEVYLKKDVDKTLAEKDKEIAELKKKLMPCLNGDCILTCEVVEKYGKENAELKKKLDKAIAERDGNQVCIDALKQKLENVQASMYCDVVDVNMENRRLKEERRWRKFPEEKPKWGEEVLVVDDENKKYIVRFSHDMKWISWGKMNTCESENVKYWMPLPSAPKETVK